ncbi:glycosyltransferase family A protein [Methanosarcina sp.]|uniref:glycosyltransferase n=1 Tax=Methanosarcina sp. TaxID=2213 RepID=UPI002AB80B34|nr:glycosyltransferase family A protein [Methanosarcina sp.]MDY9926312.1 glycosyltransferase family A protein [Methanosarcina sp.]
MSLKNYIIITPCKNEEESLLAVAESLINQTIKPSLWVIVNDCSTDNTANIIDRLTYNYSWIKKLDMQQSTSRDLGLHVAQVYINGLEFAVRYSSLNNLAFEYIGIVDADTILALNYFEKLIQEFEADTDLGICSGHGYYKLNGKVVWPDYRSDFPTGCARLLRKKCFDEIGGYTLTCSADSVSVAKAKILGWNTKRIKDISFSLTRATSGAEGLWKGYRQFAFNNYYTGYTLYHALLKGTKIFFTYPYYTGISYILSYLNCYLLRKDRIDDEEIIEYYRKIGNERLKEIYYKIIH